MKTKCMALLLSIGVFTSLVGCQMREVTEDEVYEKFEQKISKVQSYTCIAEVEVIGNKGKSNYTLKHNYTKPNNYVLEVVSPKHLKDNVMEYKDDKVVVKNSKINDLIEFSNNNNAERYLFVGDFSSNFLNKDNANFKVSDDKLILECIIPGDDEYFNKQILYVDIENKVPTKMEILDKQGNIKFIIKYKNFQYKK